MRPVFFGRPENLAEELRLAPRLASWNRSDHLDQVELKRTVESAEEQIRDVALSVDGPLALRLDVNLQTGTSLLEFRDLDNYAYPLAAHLLKAWKRPPTSMWASKAVANTSSLRCAAASERAAPKGTIVVETTAPSDSRKYKEQVAEGLPDELLAESSGRGRARFRRQPGTQLAESLEANHRCTRQTAWFISGRPWNPHDGRITDLGLHCTIDPLLGRSKVRIGVAARSLNAVTGLSIR